ncbi:MAG: hypothetical protein ACYDG5_01535 [Dehalococcoidales bacterium]
MKERIHEQISHELKQATRLDTKIAVITIVVSLIMFTIAMIFAYGSTGTITGILGGTRGTVFHTAPTIIMFVSILAILAINWYSIRTLLNNKKQRAKLNKGLVKLYKDEDVAQYYDASIFKGYETRYNLFAIILTAVAAVSVITPLVIFIDRMVNL